MVPPRDTLHGRLAAAFAPAVRVYSFAASGAPLSQYLVWAREARERWKAQALVIVVVGNDFDESLAIYKRGPGFHHYVAGADGALQLQRFDYQPSRLRIAARKSAFARYLVVQSAGAGAFARACDQRHDTRCARPAPRPLSAIPLRARARTASVGRKPPCSPSSAILPLRPAGRPEASCSWSMEFVIRATTRRSRRAISSGCVSSSSRRRVAPATRRSIWIRLFRTLSERTASDLNIPTDGHWNGLAHGLAAEAALRSNTLSRWQPSGARASR